MNALRVAYLHGFASSPDTRKGRALAEIFIDEDVVVHRPDLRQPSFAKLSPRAILRAIGDLDAEFGDADEGARWVFVGSSLGGWMASLWAAQHPARVAALLLLCPGFDLAARWPALRGTDEMARWQRDGVLPHLDDKGQPQPLHWAFYEEARALDSWPDPPMRAVVVHGRADAVVPLSSSERFVAQRPDRRRLVVVDDDHELKASLPVIERELRSLLVAAGASR